VTGLKGLRVAVGESGSGTRAVAQVLDRTLSGYVKKLQYDDIVSRTKAAITGHLPSGNLTSGVVAAEQHTSPRSLQRNLVAEGTSYRILVDAVRQELAESYLA
jgi:AraC-like DNA-binding protein